MGHQDDPRDHAEMQRQFAREQMQYDNDDEDTVDNRAVGHDQAGDDHDEGYDPKDYAEDYDEDYDEEETEQSEDTDANGPSLDRYSPGRRPWVAGQQSSSQQGYQQDSQQGSQQGYQPRYQQQNTRRPLPMKVAIIVDSGFLKYKFKFFNQSYPNADDVQTICHKKIMNNFILQDDFLFRVYYYDCFPFTGSVPDPASGERRNFGESELARIQTDFLHDLARKDRFVLRAGDLAYKGLKLPSHRLNDLANNDEGMDFGPEDLVHDFEQKQVDIMMGLDIAMLAHKKSVDKIVVVAGDSDLVPAMKLARDEGLLVYLCPLNHSVKSTMIENADGMVNIRI